MTANGNAAEKFLINCAGPEPVKEYFRRVIRRDRLAHAYLLAGPAGSGKRAFARDLAMALSCPTGEPCGQCPSCRSASNGNHPALRVYSSVDQKASLDIAEVRELTHQDHLSRRGLMVWIIEAAERLSIPATNALLKILEEPNAGALLILLAPSTGSLLPTIVSRCHRIQFSRIPGRGLAAGGGGEAVESMEGGGGTIPEFWLELAAPRFFAEWDLREWLTRNFSDPGGSGPREAVSRLIGAAMVRCQESWQEWENGERAGGVDPLPQLEELLNLSSCLDGNVNADLVLESFIRLIRRHFRQHGSR